jgi:hypothetical protein
VRLLAELDGRIHPLHKSTKPRPLDHLEVVTTTGAVNLLGSVLNEQWVSPPVASRDTRRLAVAAIGYRYVSLTSTATMVSD